MAARDRWTIELKCPQCGAGGTARVSEDDYMFMRSPGFRVDSVPDGFEVTKETEYQDQTDIGCAKCKIKVW
jgi:RecJ-like exonuclease